MIHAAMIHPTMAHTAVIHAAVVHDRRIIALKLMHAVGTLL